MLSEETVIVNPGGESAGVVALNVSDGSEAWVVESSPPAYGSYLLTTIGTRKQLIGVDETHVRSYDPVDGSLLWEFEPPMPGDFQVPTPIVWKEHLILISESTGTRMHRFDEEGLIDPIPVAVNKAFCPDTHTPVVVGNKLYGVLTDLVCLDLEAGLKQLWALPDDAYEQHASVIASPTRLLISTHDAQLHLYDLSTTPATLLGKQTVIDGEYGILTHPAVDGRRLYFRGTTSVVAVELPHE